MTATTGPAVDHHVRWRGGFGRLWTAAVLSRFGDAARTVAMPILAAGLTSSPLALSAVSAAGYLPWLLFGLIGGAVADRVDRRRAMWTIDVVRGPELRLAPYLPVPWPRPRRSTRRPWPGASWWRWRRSRSRGPGRDHAGRAGSGCSPADHRP